MNKLVLPSVATMLILVIALSSFTPAAAVRITLAPVLQVITIAEDDQIRQTGFMVLGLNPATGNPDPTVATDFMAQFKIIFLLNGRLVVPVTGTGIKVVVGCNVVQKDKEAVPLDTTTSKSIIKSRQFPRENLKTKLVDVGTQFVCKPHWKNDRESVGVLDVYFIGPQVPDFIADHMLVVTVSYTVGTQTFQGSEMQDICILGYPFGVYSKVLKTNGDYHWLLSPVSDAMANFSGCEDAALYQRYMLGLEPFVAAP